MAPTYRGEFDGLREEQRDNRFSIAMMAAALAIAVLASALVVPYYSIVPNWIGGR